MIKYFDAVSALVQGDISGPTDGPISEFSLPDGVTPPTEEAIQTKLKELQTEYDAQEYARTRAPLYPAIGDQLDALYHAGVFPKEMADKIKAVKDANPKPE